MINLDNFDWGCTSEAYKKQMMSEIFSNKETRMYERIFQVDENDIVVDIGATIGDFTYTILDKKPKHCYVVEPLGVFFDTLQKNLYGYPVSFVKAAISSEKNLEIDWDGHTEICRTLTFNEFIKENHIKKIDFLKVDCEGGEYDVYSEKNINFLIKIPKIITEFHLRSRVDKERFRMFRDNTLKNFKKFRFHSIDGVDITWDLYNENFIQYYKEVLLSIDNRD
jgi:FkbM family methyltransferase